MKTLLRSALALAAAAVCTLAAAQDHASWPTQPVRMVVSYAAGNTTDVLARLVGERLAIAWKQPVVIENRPGVAGSLGAAQVAKARPDGNTLLFTAVAAMAVNPHVYANVGYDPLKDLEYVHLVAWAPLVCAVSPQSGIASFEDLLRRSQQAPVHYGTSGSGNIPHLAVETFKSRFGLKATHVPYKAATQVFTDLASGQIQLACDAVSAVLPLIQAGRVKPIAVTSRQRLPALPDVPTLAEQRNDFTSGAWLGIAAPRGTPAAVVDRISRDVAAVLADPATVQRLSGLGFEALNLGPAPFTERVRQDHQHYGQLARALKLKAE